ncbi:hypothetical protein F5882DRAFT_311965, partial [Hyaloscypha sp. PMI_1271]
EKVNSRYLSKSDFLSSRYLSINNTIKAYLDSILASIHYLYLLSIIYNNIILSNIILKEDNILVINNLSNY